jgi:hypothetical protein
VVLDEPAPAVGGRLLDRLLRSTGHLPPQRGVDEARGEDDDSEGKADRERGHLEADAHERHGDQAGGDEPPPPGDLQAGAGEAEERREQRERRRDGRQHHGCAGHRDARHERDVHDDHAEERHHHGGAGEEDRPSSRVHGHGDGFLDRVPVVEVLPEPGDDEERVVDAHAETDHHADHAGEVRHRQRVGEDRHQDRPHADARQGHADGQAHGQHGPEGDDQDDDGEGQAEHLGVGGLEVGEGLASELDAQPVDLRDVLEDLVGDLGAVLERDVVRHLDLGVGQLPRQVTLRGDLELPALGVGAVDLEVVAPVEAGEELLHRRLDLGIVDALVSGEDDGPCHPRTLATELVVQDVEAGAALDVRHRELVAGLGAERAGHHTQDDCSEEPEHRDGAPPSIAPRTEACEHRGPPRMGCDDRTVASRGCRASPSVPSTVRSAM